MWTDQADDTPKWAYDEDGYCVSCGNGYWRFHTPGCDLRDLLDRYALAQHATSDPVRVIDTVNVMLARYALDAVVVHQHGHDADPGRTVVQLQWPLPMSAATVADVPTG